MTSSISSFDIIRVVVPELKLRYIQVHKIFLRIPASSADVVALNHNGIITLFINGVSTFFINGKPNFINSLRSLPKNQPDCIFWMVEFWIILH